MSKRSVIILSPATLINFHRHLIRKKYSKLYSTSSLKRGLRGISNELEELIVEIKSKNPSYGIEKIEGLLRHRGHQISDTTVLRILRKHGFHLDPVKQGASWISFLSDTFNGTWSLDFFRVESVSLRTFVIMVVMDIYSRKIIGIAICPYPASGVNACAMFNSIRNEKPLPHKLTTDNDPVFNYRQWQANLRVSGIEEIKSVPYVPKSHPFIERLIGTLRRDFLDKVLFFGKRDLEKNSRNTMSIIMKLGSIQALNSRRPLRSH